MMNRRQHMPIDAHDVLGVYSFFDRSVIVEAMALLCGCHISPLIHGYMQGLLSSIFGSAWR